MEQAAYISRLEKAIMQSSEAMSVLRQENAALLKINEQLKQRNVILEEEVNDLRHKSQPNTSARQSTRHKRSFASGVKCEKGTFASQGIVSQELGEPVTKMLRKDNKKKLSVSTRESNPSGLQKVEKSCNNNAIEEKEVADMLDKEFDEMSAFSSDTDNSLVECSGDESVSENTSLLDSDSDLESICGPVYEESSVVGNPELSNYIDGDSADIFSSAKGRIKHNRGKGYDPIDISGIDHSNLQIRFILEHLSMDNVHTASLLLCRHSRAPVCEILCKHIKGAGEAEAELLMKNYSATQSMFDSESSSDRECYKLSPSVGDFVKRITALIASLSERTASTGSSLCLSILNALHDSLWNHWFHTDSSSTSVPWKKRGLCNFQEKLFFGGIVADTNILNSELNYSLEEISSEIASELLSTILITVGYRQGMVANAQSVLKGYLYALQCIPCVGTSIGILNAMLLNGMEISGGASESDCEDFSKNNLLNDFLRSWSPFNICLVTESVAKRLDKMKESRIVSSRKGVLQFANVCSRYCVTIASSTVDSNLVGSLSLSLEGHNSQLDQKRKLYKSFLSYIKTCYEMGWNHANDRRVNDVVFDDVKGIVSSWKAGKTYSDENSLERQDTNVSLQSTSHFLLRFNCDALSTACYSLEGIWNEVISIDNYAGDNTSTNENSGKLLKQMGMPNFIPVISQLIHIYSNLKSIDNSVERVSCSVPFVELFSDLTLPSQCFQFEHSQREPVSDSGCVNATVSGVESWLIETMSISWRNTLDGLRIAEGDTVNNYELDIVRCLHLITSLVKKGVVPLICKRSTSFVNMNFSNVLQESVSNCKIMLLRCHITLPPNMVDKVPSSGDCFIGFEFFQAISISPLDMYNGTSMFYHCYKNLCENPSCRNQDFLDVVVELALNISHALHELLLFMVISSLKALLKACRENFVDETMVAFEFIQYNQALRRISEECMMILLQTTSSISATFTKCNIIFDIFSTVSQLTRLRNNESLISKKIDVSAMNEIKCSRFPFPLSTWMWQQACGKIPAFVINLDVRDDRWMNMIEQCEVHSLLPFRIAAIDARKKRDFRSVLDDGLSDNIPPEVVVLTWDSTTNNLFDKKCVVNVATPMTPSERACAASHVMVWKLIGECFANGSSPTSSISSVTSSSIIKPSAHNNNKIPRLWINFPRPRYQKKAVEESERVSRIDVVRKILTTNGGGRIANSQAFLVLEDDAMIITTQPKRKGKNRQLNSRKLLRKDFLDRLEIIHELLPADFDICYLGYAGRTLKKKVKKIFVRPKYVWQLHAYLLSPKGAMKLLSFLPVSAPVDNFIAKLTLDNILEAYAIHPDAMLVKQGGTFSSRQSNSDVVHSASLR